MYHTHCALFSPTHQTAASQSATMVHLYLVVLHSCSLLACCMHAACMQIAFCIHATPVLHRQAHMVYNFFGMPSAGTWCCNCKWCCVHFSLRWFSHRHTSMQYMHQASIDTGVWLTITFGMWPMAQLSLVNILTTTKWHFIHVMALDFTCCLAAKTCHVH